MWRMFRAALLGVVIGVIGGVIVGQVSYVRNYRDRLAKEIRSNAVMYNNGSSDGNGMIRIKVNYDGAGTDSEEDAWEMSYWMRWKSGWVTITAADTVTWRCGVT